VGWKDNFKGGALFLNAVYFKARPMFETNVFDYGQTQAGALLIVDFGIINTVKSFS